MFMLELRTGRVLRYVTRWAEMHRERLAEENSSLEFKLHRLHFIHLIRQGYACQREALLYARNFSPFASQHPRGWCSSQKHLFALKC